MRVRTTGGRAGWTCTLAGVQFVDGKATLRGSIEDVAKMFRYLSRAYQVEVDDGNSQVHSGADLNPDSTVRRDGESVERRAEEVSADAGPGDAETEARPTGLYSQGIGQAERITTALSQLDSNNDEHWTGAGRPRIDVMAQLTGLPQLTRRELDKVAPDFKRGG